VGTPEQEQARRHRHFHRLHLAGVLYYLLAPTHMPMKPPAVKGGQMVYIAPLDPKKSVKPTPKPDRPSRSRNHPQADGEARRRWRSAKLETYVPPVQATMTPPPEQDMSEMIAKRRAAREAQNPQPQPSPPAESEAERAAHRHRQHRPRQQCGDGGRKRRPV
jgi:hypothetical protein